MADPENQARRTVESYIAGRIKEARQDAVAFGEIVFSGKYLFKIADEDLERFMREVLSALLQSGTRVVRPLESTHGGGWELIPKYQLPTTEETVQALIEDSRNYAKEDQDFFAWFAFVEHKEHKGVKHKGVRS